MEAHEEIEKIEAIFPSYIDSTMLEAFKSCPRKFYNEFVLGLRLSYKNVHLHAGGAFAAALQAFYNSYYQTLSTEDAKLSALRQFLKEWGPEFEAPEKSSKTLVNMWAAVISYVENYPPEADETEPFYINDQPGIETTFAIPLLPEDGFSLHPVSKEPLFYCGRLDFIGTKNGYLRPRDDKTTQYFRSNWHEEWDLRSQFLGYLWALKKYNYNVKEMTIRGIAILKNEIQHQEIDVLYPKHLIDRWYHQMRRDVNRAVACWEEGYFDYNLGYACTQFSGCIFRDLCKAKHPEGYYDNYIVNRWNPLADKNDENNNGE